MISLLADAVAAVPHQPLTFTDIAVPVGLISTGVTIVVTVVGGLWRGQELFDKYFVKTLASEDGRKKVYELMDERLRSEATINWMEAKMDVRAQNFVTQIERAIEKSAAKIEGRLDSIDAHVKATDDRLRRVEGLVAVHDEKLKD